MSYREDARAEARARAREAAIWNLLAEDACGCLAGVCKGHVSPEEVRRSMAMPSDRAIESRWPGILARADGIHRGGGTGLNWAGCAWRAARSIMGSAPGEEASPRRAPDPVGEILGTIDASLRNGIGEVLVAPPGFWHLFKPAEARATRRERRHLCPGTVVRERAGSSRRIGLVMARAYDEAGGCDFLTVRWWSRLGPTGGTTSLPASRASRLWRRAGAADRLRVRQAYGSPHTCRGSSSSSACALCGREVPEGSPRGAKAMQIEIREVAVVVQSVRRVAVVDREALTSPSLRILAAYVERRQVGALYFTTYEEVVGVGVVRDMRRRGVARSLWYRAAHDLGVRPADLVAQAVTADGRWLLRAMGAE